MATKELTERQREVLVAYLRLGTVTKTALEVGITVRGVRASLDTVKQKLGVEDVHGLMTAAIEQGIITLETAS
jgi:DNA-binding NarL/FixJ family response regulator